MARAMAEVDAANPPSVTIAQPTGIQSIYDWQLAGHQKAHLGTDVRGWEAALKKFGADNLGKLYSIALKRLRPDQKIVYWSLMSQVIEQCVSYDDEKEIEK
jgi:hypothetical protein